MSSGIQPAMPNNDNDDDNNGTHEAPPRSPSQPMQAGRWKRKRIYFGSDNRKTNSRSPSRSTAKSNCVHPLAPPLPASTNIDKEKSKIMDPSASCITSPGSEKRKSLRLAEAKTQLEGKGVDDRITLTEKGGQSTSTMLASHKRTSAPKTPARLDDVPPRPPSRHRQPIPLLSPPSPTKAPVTITASNKTMREGREGALSHSSVPLPLETRGTTALETPSKLEGLKFGFLHEDSYVSEPTDRSFYTREASRTIAQMRANLLQTPTLDRHSRRNDGLDFSSPTPPPTSLVTPGLDNAGPSSSKSKRLNNEDVFGPLSPDLEPEEDDAAENRDPLFDISKMPPLREPPPLYPYAPDTLPADPAEYFSRYQPQKQEQSSASRPKTRRSYSRRRLEPYCPSADLEDDQDRAQTQKDKSPAGSDEPPTLTHEPSFPEQQPPTDIDQPVTDVEDLPVQTEKPPVSLEAEGARFKYPQTASTIDIFAYIPVANPHAAAPLDYRRRQVQSSLGPILVEDSDQEGGVRFKDLGQARGGFEEAQTDTELPPEAKKSRSSRTKKKTYARGRTHAYKAGIPDPVLSSQRRSLSPDVFGSYTAAKRKDPTAVWQNDDHLADPVHHEFIRNGPWPELREQGLFDPASPPPTNRGPMTRNGKRYGPITKAFNYVSDPESDEEVNRPRKRRKHKKRPRSDYTEVAKLRMARDRSAEKRMHAFIRKQSQHRSTIVPRRRTYNVSRIPGYNLKAIPIISMDAYKQLHHNKPPSSSHPTPQEVIGDPRVPELIASARRAALEARIRGQKRYTRQISPPFPTRPLRATQDDPQNNDRIERFGSQQAHPRLQTHPHTYPLPKLRLVNGRSESPALGKRRREQDDSTIASDTTGRESGLQQTALEHFLNFPSRRSMQKKTNLGDFLSRLQPTSASPQRDDFDCTLIPVDFLPIDLSSSSASRGRNSETKRDDNGISELDGDEPIDFDGLQSLAELSKQPVTPQVQGNVHQSIPPKEPQPTAADDSVTQLWLARNDILAAAKREGQREPTPPPPCPEKIQSSDRDITDSQVQQVLNEEEAERERKRQLRHSGSTASADQLNAGVFAATSCSVVPPDAGDAGKQKASSDPTEPYPKAISLATPKVPPSSDPPSRASKSISKRPSRTGLELTDHLMAQVSNLKNVAMLNSRKEGQSSTRPSASSTTGTGTGKRVQRVEDRRERVSAKHRASAEKTLKQTTLDFGKTVGGSGSSGFELSHKTTTVTATTVMEKGTTLDSSLDLGDVPTVDPATSARTTPTASSIDRRPLSAMTPARIGLSASRTLSSTSQTSNQFTPTQLQERYQRSSQTTMSMPYKNPTRHHSQATQFAEEEEKSHSKENTTLRPSYDKEGKDDSLSRQHHTSDTSGSKAPTPIPRGKYPFISPMANNSLSSPKQDRANPSTTSGSAGGERRRAPLVEIGKESSSAQKPIWQTWQTDH